MARNLPSAQRGWAAAVALLGFLALAILAAERYLAEDRRFHHGRVEGGPTAELDALRVELRAAEYQRAVTRVGPSRAAPRLPRPPEVRLDLWVWNAGDTHVALPLPGSDAGAPMTAPYLVDEHGRAYPARCARWHQRPGEPPRDIGRVLPGWGAGITLHFPGIPAEVRDLVLVLEPIARAGTVSATVHLPVPLP